MRLVVVAADLRVNQERALLVLCDRHKSTSPPKKQNNPPKKKTTTDPPTPKTKRGTDGGKGKS